MFAAMNLEQSFERVTEYWSPKVVGRVNDQLLKVAKLKGDFVWHSHDGEDELFYIVKGELRMDFENGEQTTMRKGDFLNVPKGVRHKPFAGQECWVLVIEPASALHTGAEVTERTKTLEQQMSS